ncbi:uncharacterized protein LOC116189234 [Punica granatum]|uniref:Uncharacterized protein n=2 Tax=Punica granatum TaxID=22663 RepID=A0A2I0JUG9_PUNGR|nr:uncharacterized protein LOC116189234 [Punica granatum]PKI59116.1 hypothetical protein CRG98_020482 [Punica granatum]
MWSSLSSPPLLESVVRLCGRLVETSSGRKGAIPWRRCIHVDELEAEHLSGFKRLFKKAITWRSCGDFSNKAVICMDFLWELHNKTRLAPGTLNPLLAAQTINNNLQAYEKAWYSKLSQSQAACKLECSSDQLHFYLDAPIKSSGSRPGIATINTKGPLVHAWTFKDSARDSFQGELFAARKAIECALSLQP